LEVGKALRTHAIEGHRYSETGGTADFIPSPEEGSHEIPDHTVRPFPVAETLEPSAIRNTDRAASILRAWVAADPATIRLIEEARSIARTSSTVLIRGESGTGKDLLAWILYALSTRAGRPLVRIDCASLPAELIDGEIFGHEDGIVPPPTGASGRLELAAGGTLLLDEIAALSIPAQARLLRVIEERRFERIGGAQSIGVDTRIIALTTANLEQAVARRTFREDLYYRLNVIPMTIPPLRERITDITLLANYFLERLAEMHSRPHTTFSIATLAALESYAFPGNVRELRIIVERALLASHGNEILPTDLPPHIRDCSAGAVRNKMSLEDMERAYIADVLEHTRGKKTQASKILGISRKTLLEKRKRYRLG
jgi:DNA-binding NtrC family response regulator